MNAACEASNGHPAAFRLSQRIGRLQRLLAGSRNRRRAICLSAGPLTRLPRTTSDRLEAASTRARFGLDRGGARAAGQCACRSSIPIVSEAQTALTWSAACAEEQLSSSQLPHARPVPLIRRSAQGTFPVDRPAHMLAAAKRRSSLGRGYVRFRRPALGTRPRARERRCYRGNDATVPG